MCIASRLEASLPYRWPEAILSHGQYVATGLVWLILALAGFLMTKSLSDDISAGFQRSGSTRKRLLELSLVAPLFLGHALISWLLLNLFAFRTPFWGARFFLALGVLMAPSGLLCFSLGLYKWDWAANLQRKAAVNPVVLIRDAVFPLPISLSGYSWFIYPQLPAMFGGPDNSVVRFVVKGQFSFSALPSWVKRDGNLVGPLRLVSESDDALFATEPLRDGWPTATVPANEPLLRIRRDQVDAVIYDTHN